MAKLRCGPDLHEQNLWPVGSHRHMSRPACLGRGLVTSHLGDRLSAHLGGPVGNEVHFA
jgi:hypothetical protein